MRHAESAKPLFPAAGQRPSQLLAPCDHAETFEAFFHGGLALWNLVKPRNEIQIFLDAQIFVEAEFLRHVADVLFYLGTLRAKIVAETTAFAIVGLEQTAEHSQGRWSCRCRWDREAVDFPGPDLHGDMVDDGARAEFFRDIAHVNDEGRNSLKAATFNIQHRIFNAN